MIVAITDDQRTAIRETLEAAQAAGRNPRSTALDIAGRLNRLTGRREGGIIGLTSGQARAVARARVELEGLDEGYFNRKLRDKRFDSTVRRAISDGKPLNKAEVQRLVDRYSDRMLILRSENIARTEAISALHAGQYEALLQLVDKGKVRADQITKIWSATGDGRTRDTHQILNGQAAKLREAFVSASGALMLFPQDISLGAPGDEVINCRCAMTVKIDYLGALNGR